MSSQVPVDPSRVPTDPWFFISYASYEYDVHIERFRTDLAGQLRSLAGILDPDNKRVGYLDTSGLEPSVDWPEALYNALQRSKVLIPFYSPLYFKREYCGKEFEAFLRPQSLDPAWTGGRRPILPVLFYPLAPEDLQSDPAIGKIQASTPTFPRAYLDHGLHYIMDTPGHDRDYKEFLRSFALQLKALALAAPDFAPMAAGTNRDLSSVPSAFGVPPKPVLTPTAQQSLDWPGSCAPPRRQGKWRGWQTPMARSAE